VVAAPKTRYAKSGDIDIAYQVLGDGPVDLLMFAGAAVPIDCVDDERGMARFQRRLASFCRVIRFDLRGMGLSDHVPPQTLTSELWAADALSVLDAVGSRRAAVFAPGISGVEGIILAARHPDVVQSLVLVNGSARAMWAPDYPAGVASSYVDPFLSVGVAADALEQGFDALAIVAPSVAGDGVFRSWWDRSGNRAASPSVARAVSSVIAQSDVRDLLPQISVPTLIMHRVDNKFITVEHGRYLARHVPGAKYLELPGADTLYWVGDTSRMLDEVEEFLTGARGGSDVDRVLATVLFTDIVGSTDLASRLGDQHWRDLLDQHDRLVRRELERYHGTEVNTVGDGFLATFTSPSRAIECAESILESVSSIGLELRAGLHAGEIEVRGADIAGMVVHIGARVSAQAAAGEILVSSTVRELVTGSSRVLLDRGEHQLKGVPGDWRLFAVVR